MEENRRMKCKDVDCGWAWIVLVSAFFTRIVIGGALWAMTQYFVVFHEEFEESKSYTAVIGAVVYATYYSAAPLASFLILRCGVRWTTIIGGILAAGCYVLNVFANGVLYLILTHGLLLGISLSLVSNASIISLGLYFDKYNYIVTGVSLAGTGFGVFIFAVLIPFLLDKYLWRGTMYIMASISLQLCIMGSILYPKQRENNKQNQKQTNDSEPQKKPKTLLKSVRFWCLNSSQFFFCVSIISLVVLFKDFALSRHLGGQFAWSVAAFGVGDIGGRFLSGFLVSLPAFDSSVLLFTVDLVVAVTIVVICFVATPIVFVICSLLLGIGIGAQVALQFILPSDVFGRDRYVVVLGYVQTTAGIGSLIGPPLAGIITDFDESYEWTFAFIASLQVVAGLLVVVVYFVSKKRRGKDERVEGALVENLSMNPRAVLVKRSAEVGLELFVNSQIFRLRNF